MKRLNKRRSTGKTRSRSTQPTVALPELPRTAPPATRLQQRRSAPTKRPNPTSRPPASAARRREQRSSRRRLSLYALRFGILSIGFSAIAGTLLAATNRSQLSLRENNPALQEVAAITVPPPALLLEQESTELESRVQALAAKLPNLQPGVLLADLDTGVYVDIAGSETFAAASTIKLPILIAFFQDVDRGKISLEEMLTMTEATLAGEAGNMQYKKTGTQFSALETVTQMITVSDNTATNMIIERLGGAERLNRRFQDWGLTATAIANNLPDVEGTNTTSPMDLAQVLAKLEAGELVSPESRDRIMTMMQNIITNDLLPSGLGKNATIAHKTGNIGSLVADAGTISTPTGKRYLAVVMVQRPHNNPQAKQLIRDISRSAYQYFDRALPAPNVTVTPAQTTDEIATE